MNSDNNEIYTCARVAEMLHLRVATVYRLIRSNQLEAFTINKQYRVTKQAFEAFVTKNKKE